MLNERIVYLYKVTEKIEDNRILNFLEENGSSETIPVIVDINAPLPSLKISKSVNKHFLNYNMFEDHSSDNYESQISIVMDKLNKLLLKLKIEDSRIVRLDSSHSFIVDATAKEILGLVNTDLVSKIKFSNIHRIKSI